MGTIAYIDPPSRNSLNARDRKKQWSHMYRAILVPMSSLCMLTAISSTLKYFHTDNTNWAIGTAIIATILPFSLFLMKPVYSKILSADEECDL